MSLPKSRCNIVDAAFATNSRHGYKRWLWLLHQLDGHGGAWCKRVARCDTKGKDECLQFGDYPLVSFVVYKSVQFKLWDFFSCYKVWQTFYIVFTLVLRISTLVPIDPVWLKKGARKSRKHCMAKRYVITWYTAGSWMHMSSKHE